MHCFRRLRSLHTYSSGETKTALGGESRPGCPFGSTVVTSANMHACMSPLLPLAQSRFASLTADISIHVNTAVRMYVCACIRAYAHAYNPYTHTLVHKHPAPTYIPGCMELIFVHPHSGQHLPLVCRRVKRHGLAAQRSADMCIYTCIHICTSVHLNSGPVDAFKQAFPRVFRGVSWTLSVRCMTPYNRRTCTVAPCARGSGSARPSTRIARSLARAALCCPHKLQVIRSSG